MAGSFSWILVFAETSLEGYTKHTMRWDIKAHNEKIRRRLRLLRKVKTWQLIVVLLLASIVAATLLRLNNLGMVGRLEAVKVADEKGDKEEINKALTELRSYVFAHMNTDIPKETYLVHSHGRDRDAALASAQDATNPNSEEYEAASIECREKWQGGVASFRNDYVKCVIDRVAALSGQSSADMSAQLPKPDMYRVSYASPLWSPDMAGFSVLFCIFIIMVILIRFIGVIVLQAMVKRKFTSI